MGVISVNSLEQKGFYPICSVESNKIDSESRDYKKSSADQGKEESPIDEETSLRKLTLEQEEIYRGIKIGKDLMGYYYYDEYYAQQQKQQQ
jgi:hypothetical protein